MKNVFLALVLANLLFLGWKLWIAPAEVAPMGLLVRGDEPEIALARPPAAKRGTEAPPDGTARCVRLGPIGDGVVADAVRARLGAGGLESSMTTDEGQVWVGHWVQVEGVASRAEADQVVARLAAGGLPDAYVLQTAAPFSVSLGVFRDRVRADAVVASARALGLSPSVTDRYRSGLQYWLTVALPPGRVVPLDELVRESGQILRAEEITCAAPEPAPPQSPASG